MKVSDKKALKITLDYLTQGYQDLVSIKKDSPSIISKKDIKAFKRVIKYHLTEEQYKEWKRSGKV